MSIYHVRALSTRCKERRLNTDIPNDRSSLILITTALLIELPTYMLTCTLSKSSVPHEKLEIIPISRVCGSLQRGG